MNDADQFANASILAQSTVSEFLGAVFVLDEAGTIVAWNDGACTLFGYDEREVLGRSVFDTIIPPELAEAKREWLSTAARTGSAIYEAMRLRKDHTRIWVDVSIRVGRDANGGVLLALNERDITRSKYQRQAQLLQTRFRSVLETGPDAIVLADTLGRIVLVNSETERLFGFTRDELLGEFVERLVPTRFHGSHPGHRGHYFAGPQTRPMGIGLELLGRRKDGAEFPVEISLSPLSIDDTTLAMAAIRDVTARKLTEEALKAANAELEAFTYSVSHDLRAPIRQIQGFAKILTEHLGDSLDGTGALYLQRIQEGSQHMGRLVDDLLHLAQLGRQDIKPTPVNLSGIAERAWASVLAENPDRNIDFTIDPLPTVMCDPGLMAVVFTNLLSNAAKYTRQTPDAKVRVGQAVENGSVIVFVRDNGVGFDMQYADKLFGVFQRLHRAEEFEGTGVGLATVQRIIRKHGGAIWAAAAPHHGATFKFTLARAVGDQRQP